MVRKGQERSGKVRRNKAAGKAKLRLNETRSGKVTQNQERSGEVSEG